MRRLFILLLSLAAVAAACSHTASDAASYRVDLPGATLKADAFPYPLQQALYELEYAKRVSEKMAINQYLADAFLQNEAAKRGVRVEAMEQELFPVAKPDAATLALFHEQMKTLLPPDLDRHKDLIEAQYLRLKKAQLKRERMKTMLDTGAITIKAPDLAVPRFSLPLPSTLPAKGPASPAIDIVIVSVQNCDVCQDRETFVQNLYERFKSDRALRLRVIDVYADDTTAAAYPLYRALICAAPTAAYWQVREKLFKDKDTVTPAAIAQLIPTASKPLFDQCLSSTEPELIAARNLTLAQDLYYKNVYSIYINQEKLAFATADLMEAKLKSLSAAP